MNKTTLHKIKSSLLIVVCFIAGIIGYFYELFPQIFPDWFIKVFGPLGMIIGILALFYLLFTAYKINKKRKRR